MSIMSERQENRSRQGNAILRFPDLTPATVGDFSGENNVIFIHGFTADSTYLRQLMAQFYGAKFNTFAFEYECFRGIDRAAESLFFLLSVFERSGAKIGKLVIVGHSMGGLVARAFISLAGGAKYTRMLITLGTPHNGTLKDTKVLEYMLAWSESLNQAISVGYSAECRSAQQLLGKDSDIALLEILKKPIDPLSKIEFVSISGGYEYLEFGKNPLKNYLANKWLQSNLKKPNDGLVEEESSNTSHKDFVECMPKAEHFQDYPEHDRVNHSNLVFNQSVALLAVANALSFKAQATSAIVSASE